MLIDTARVWDSYLHNTYIRLQGGNFTNQGRVEVYCNGQWGTICSDGFGPDEANTVCKQLGYSGYISYNELNMYKNIQLL